MGGWIGCRKRVKSAVRANNNSKRKQNKKRRELTSIPRVVHSKKFLSHGCAYGDKL